MSRAKNLQQRHLRSIFHHLWRLVACQVRNVLSVSLSAGESERGAGRQRVLPLKQSSSATANQSIDALNTCATLVAWLDQTVMYIHQMTVVHRHVTQDVSSLFSLPPSALGRVGQPRVVCALFFAVVCLFLCDGREISAWPAFLVLVAAAAMKALQLTALDRAQHDLVLCAARTEAFFFLFFSLVSITSRTSSTIRQTTTYQRQPLTNRGESPRGSSNSACTRSPGGS